MSNLETGQPVKAISPIQLPAAVWAGLAEAYSQPGRAYHNWRHIEEMVGHWQDVQTRIGWQRPIESFLATLFHDVVYDSLRQDNEALSACKAADWLYDVEHVDNLAVQRLIRLTAHHGRLRPDIVADDQALFLDCDMAVLGAEPKRYDEYTQGVWAEYGHLPEATFVDGRRRFLNRLMSNRRLFLSDDFNNRLAKPAKSNINRELLTLTARSK